MPHLTPPEVIVAQHWPGFTSHGLPIGLSKEVHAVPHVSHGRWSVRCPFCPSSQYASKADHRFFCVECFNLDVGMEWVEVKWPRNWEKIEEALSMRPRVENRNWEAPETLRDLLTENRAHGVSA